MKHTNFNFFLLLSIVIFVLGVSCGGNQSPSTSPEDEDGGAGTFQEEELGMDDENTDGEEEEEMGSTDEHHAPSFSGGNSFGGGSIAPVPTGSANQQQCTSQHPRVNGRLTVDYVNCRYQESQNLEASHNPQKQKTTSVTCTKAGEANKVIEVWNYQWSPPKPADGVLCALLENGKARAIAHVNGNYCVSNTADGTSFTNVKNYYIQQGWQCQ